MKINSDKDLDDLFQNKLAEEKMTPSGKLWNNIETELDKGGRKPAAWWWFGIGGALLLLLGGTYFLMHDDGNKISDQKNISAVDKTVGNKQSTIDNKTIDHQTIDKKEDSKIQNSSSSENTTIKNNNDQVENKNVEKKDNSIVSPPKNDATKNSKSISTPTHKIKKSDDKVNPNLDERKDEHEASLPPKKERIEMQKGGMGPEKKQTNNGKSNVNTKKDGSAPLTITKKEDGNEKEENKTMSMTASKKEEDDSLDRSISHPEEFAPIESNEDLTKLINAKDSVPENTKTIVKKTDSTKTIAKKSDSTKTIASAPPITKQDSSPIKKDRFRRFYVAVFYSPDQNNAFYSSAKNWEYSNTSALYNFQQTISPSHSIGFKFGWMCNKWLSIGSGVHVSTFAEKSDELIVKYYRFTPYTFTLNTNMGQYAFNSHSFDINDNSQPTYITGDTMRLAFRTNEELNYISIPLTIRFHFLNSRFVTMYGSAGLNEDVLRSSTQQLTVERSGKVLDLQYLQGHSNYSTSFSLSFGAELHIIKGLGIWCEPTYRRRAGKILIENYSPTNNKSIQIPIGLIYRF